MIKRRLKHAVKGFGKSVAHNTVNALSVLPGTRVIVGGVRGMNRGREINRSMGLDPNLNRGRNFMTGAIRVAPVANSIYGATINPDDHDDIMEYRPTRSQIIVAKRRVSR